MFSINSNRTSQLLGHFGLPSASLPLPTFPGALPPITPGDVYRHAASMSAAPFAPQVFTSPPPFVPNGPQVVGDYLRTLDDAVAVQDGRRSPFMSGLFMPAMANAAGGRHQADVASVMSNPSLTVEDKVTMLLMLITKKMDNDIEQQSMRLTQLQNTNAGGVAGGGGMLPGGGGLPDGGMLPGGGDQAPSIDIESMKLKRMVDKRSQMFDVLRSIIDRYNETAKNLIQTIGR